MIRIVEDIGAPLAVTVVDLVTETAAPTWNEWANYGMTAIGYVGAWMGMGGDFVKNVGIASLPLTAKKLYARVRAITPVSRAARYPAMPVQPQFQGVRLV